MSAEEIKLTKLQEACLHDWYQPFGRSQPKCAKCDVREDQWHRWYIQKLEVRNERLSRQLNRALDLASAFTVLGMSAEAIAALEEAGGKVVHAKQRYNVYPPHGSVHPKPGLLLLPTGVTLYMTADFARQFDGIELRVITESDPS